MPPVQIQRYQSRISGPLLDRIDIQVEVPPVRVEDIERAEQGESSATIRKRVNAARQIQSKRFAKEETVHCNAQMGPKLLKVHCPLNDQSTSLLYQAIDRLGLSPVLVQEFLKLPAPLQT